MNILMENEFSFVLLNKRKPDQQIEKYDELDGELAYYEKISEIKNRVR
jgi:hypothetical protein